MSKDFYIIEAGAAYPESYAADMPAAIARKAAKEIEQPGKAWEIMPCDDYFATKENGYLSKPLKEIDAPKFNEMLECLPPLYPGNGDATFRFNMCEFQFGQITEQFAQYGDRYFAKYVRHGKPETYITAEMIAALPVTVEA